MSRRPIVMLLIGVIIVGTLSAGLLVWRDRQYSRVGAINAELKASMYNVGLDYSGVLTSQNVQRGQFVQKDDLLGTLKSGSLMQKLRDGELEAKDLPYTVNAKSEVELRAVKPGIIKEMNFDSGSFVAANEDLYTIIDVADYYVTSTFDVSETMLQELDNQKVINLTLQNGTIVPTKIRDITISRDGVKHKVTIESAPKTRLATQSFKLGEPVKATLIMKDRDTMTTVEEWMGTAVQKTKDLFKI
jgi:multidrug efflux pump subunit AcrA (membrane-fusion protein)